MGARDGEDVQAHDVGCPWVLLALSHQEATGALPGPHMPQEAWPHFSQLRTQWTDDHQVKGLGVLRPTLGITGRDVMTAGTRQLCAEDSVRAVLEPRDCPLLVLDEDSEAHRGHTGLGNAGFSPQLRPGSEREQFLTCAAPGSGMAPGLLPVPVVARLQGGRAGCCGKERVRCRPSCLSVHGAFRPFPHAVRITGCSSPPVSQSLLTRAWQGRTCRTRVADRDVEAQM